MDERDLTLRSDEIQVLIPKRRRRLPKWAVVASCYHHRIADGCEDMLHLLTNGGRPVGLITNDQDIVAFGGEIVQLMLGTRANNGICGIAAVRLASETECDCTV